MDVLQKGFVVAVSNALYSYVLIYLLVGAGIYFTVRTRFVQVRYFGRMLRQLRRSGSNESGISWRRPLAWRRR
jgi:AGCS family alanine or glycine:cation symporter